jgi:formate dehydrogenase subunit gamma
MDATTPPPEPFPRSGGEFPAVSAGNSPPDRGVGGGETRRVRRFDGVERALHWATAVLFLVLLATAAALFVDPISRVVGRRALVRDVHVWAGLLLPVPGLLAFTVGRTAELLADRRRLDRWTAEDRRWLRSLGRDPYARTGKFSPGQKLNAAIVAGSVPVMLATGVVMRWFEPFPLDWRRGATFVHDWLAVALFLLIAGHILLGLADREALRGIVRGTVSDAWARKHHPAWLDEEEGADLSVRR